jgi:hypothetical protein
MHSRAVDGSAPASPAIAHAAALACDKADALVMFVNVQNAVTLDVYDVTLSLRAEPTAKKRRRGRACP